MNERLLANKTMTRHLLSMMFLLCVPLSIAWAQTTAGANSASRGVYATDTFEGFSDADDENIPQKKVSWWSISGAAKDSPREQLAYADDLMLRNDLSDAAEAYDDLVRKWPTAKEAPGAQMKLAYLFEKEGRYIKAFDEFQYLITFYTGLFCYDDVIAEQYKIANAIVANNRSMFGWMLDGTIEMRQRFERIVRNAPRAPCVPDAMLQIATMRINAGELSEAINVYDELINRFPKSEQAYISIYKNAECRYTLAVKMKYNETRCRSTINYLKLVLKQFPDYPQKDTLIAWQNELTTMLREQNYKQAVFYDTRQRDRRAAITAYARFVTEFPDAPDAAAARKRLTELEHGAEPLRK